MGPNGTDLIVIDNEDEQTFVNGRHIDLQDKDQMFPYVSKLYATPVRLLCQLCSDQRGQY